MIKKITIPRCLERTPEIFGFSVQTAVISFALTFLGLIMIAKSIWGSLLIIGIMYGNIKLTKKYKKVGGLFTYLILLIEKKESIRVNSSIKSLIQNNNHNGR
jgi:type IV secretory pathway VirB3-like protein